MTLAEKKRTTRLEVCLRPFDRLNLERLIDNTQLSDYNEVLVGALDLFYQGVIIQQAGYSLAMRNDHLLEGYEMHIPRDQNDHDYLLDGSPAADSALDLFAFVLTEPSFSKMSALLGWKVASSQQQLVRRLVLKYWNIVDKVLEEPHWRLVAVTTKSEFVPLVIPGLMVQAVSAQPV